MKCLSEFNLGCYKQQIKTINGHTNFNNADQGTIFYTRKFITPLCTQHTPNMELNTNINKMESLSESQVMFYNDRED